MERWKDENHTAKISTYDAFHRGLDQFYTDFKNSTLRTPTNRTEDAGGQGTRAA